MDTIILGLLLLCDRTIYQLRERIDSGLSMMYSSSTGSIQAAIKKLLAAGLIDYVETVENGKYKKVYRITDSGRRYFLDWVNAPIEPQGVKCPALVKVYFMGFCDKDKQENSIRAYVDSLREQYRVLDMICEDAKQMQIPPDKKDIADYQLVCAMYGRDLYQFSIDWFESLAATMQGGAL